MPDYPIITPSFSYHFILFLFSYFVIFVFKILYNQDFEALEKHTSYDEGFHKDHRLIRWFWTIVHDYDIERKRRLLHFITGSDRVPLKGLSQLPILIQRNGDDSDR